MTTNLKDAEAARDRLFILQYAEQFNAFLPQIDGTSKEIIRKNKALNNMYDLFLDFIIDSKRHLDYNKE
jgi:negative regulator of sigma E activity